jgi:hypothetical protein
VVYSEDCSERKLRLNGCLRKNLELLLCFDIDLMFRSNVIALELTEGSKLGFHFSNDYNF